MYLVDSLRSRGRENFPVALRILPAAVRSDLLAIYGYARYVDDLGDVGVGDRVKALHSVRSDVLALYDGGAAAHPAVTALRPTIERHQIPKEPLLRLVDANLMDQEVTRYPTFDDLLGYCRLSANPVGELVLHIFGENTDDTIALSDRVCTGLQLIEHWQDVAEDRANGRIYLPQEDLRRFGVGESDLDQPVATASVRSLIAFETDRALCWLDAGAYLVSALHGWARLAVSGYVAGGRAAAAELGRHDFDPMSGVAKPGARKILSTWLRASVRSPG
ncbi:MAG: squalene synthase HpnC [Nocardioidaceae bacterium]